jgi:hypothetical protein
VTGVRPAVYLYEADLVQILQVIRCACKSACRKAWQGGLAGEQCACSCLWLLCSLSRCLCCFDLLFTHDAA